MERMNDQQTRLFYGAFNHAENHSTTLPEFKSFTDLVSPAKLNVLYNKVVRFQNEKTDCLSLTKEEWGVCQKLVDAETSLLFRLSKENDSKDDKHSFLDAAESFAKCKDILKVAYDASIKTNREHLREMSDTDLAIFFDDVFDKLGVDVAYDCWKRIQAWLGEESSEASYRDMARIATEQEKTLTTEEQKSDNTLEL